MASVLESSLLPMPIANSAVKHLKKMLNTQKKEGMNKTKTKEKINFNSFLLFLFLFLMQICHINSVFYPKLLDVFFEVSWDFGWSI